MVRTADALGFGSLTGSRDLVDMSRVPSCGEDLAALFLRPTMVDQVEPSEAGLPDVVEGRGFRVIVTAFRVHGGLLCGPRARCSRVGIRRFQMLASDSRRIGVFLLLLLGSGLIFVWVDDHERLVGRWIGDLVGP